MQKATNKNGRCSLEKICVPNHNLPAREARRLTRAIEKKVRRGGKKAIQEGLRD